MRANLQIPGVWIPRLLATDVISSCENQTMWSTSTFASFFNSFSLRSFSCLWSSSLLIPACFACCVTCCTKLWTTCKVESEQNVRLPRSAMSFAPWNSSASSCAQSQWFFHHPEMSIPECKTDHLGLILVFQAECLVFNNSLLDLFDLLLGVILLWRHCVSLLEPIGLYLESKFGNKMSYTRALEYVSP